MCVVLRRNHASTARAGTLSRLSRSHLTMMYHQEHLYVYSQSRLRLGNRLLQSVLPVRSLTTTNTCQTWVCCHRDAVQYSAERTMDSLVTATSSVRGEGKKHVWAVAISLLIWGKLELASWLVVIPWPITTSGISAAMSMADGLAAPKPPS